MNTEALSQHDEQVSPYHDLGYRTGPLLTPTSTSQASQRSTGKPPRTHGRRRLTPFHPSNLPHDNVTPNFERPSDYNLTDADRLADTADQEEYVDYQFPEDQIVKDTPVEYLAYLSVRDSLGLRQAS